MTKREAINYNEGLTASQIGFWLTMLQPFSDDIITTAVTSLLYSCDDVQYRHLPPFAKLKKK